MEDSASRKKLRKQVREILKSYKGVEDSTTVEPERIKSDPRLERDLKALALLADLEALRGYALVYTWCPPGDRTVKWNGSVTQESLGDKDPGNIKMDSLTMLRDGCKEIWEDIDEMWTTQQRSEEELIRRWKAGDPDMDEETSVLAEKLDAARQPRLSLVRDQE